MRKVSLVGIEDEYRNAWMVRFLGKPSEVEHLEFSSCLIPDKIMYNFLRGFPRLKTLKWEERVLPHAIGQMSPWESENESRARGLTDGFWLGVALQMHNKDTLESLQIKSSPPLIVSNFIGDISGFLRLRYLEIDHGGLHSSEGIDKAILPKSLEELRVDCGGWFMDFNQICGYCCGVVVDAYGDNTILKRILLICRFELSQLDDLIQDVKKPGFAMLEDRCQSRGVDLSILCDDGTLDTHMGLFKV